MKITKKAIQDALASNRKLQAASYRDWDNDPEARLILQVRKIQTDWLGSAGMTKTQILEELYSRLYGKDYSELQKTNKE